MEQQKIKISDTKFNKNIKDIENNINQEIFELKSELTFNTLKQYLQNQETLNKNYNLQKNAIDKLEKIINESPHKNSSDIILHDLIQEKDVIQIEINKLKFELTKIDKNIVQYIEEYIPYQKKIVIEQNLNEINLELKIVDKKLKNLYTLREKCRQAEFLSIEETVKNLNIRSKYYLDKMFSGNIINVRLENYRPTGKGKNVRTKGQMNMSIFYKNNEYDSINQLSGGERDRVNLAFILSVNDIIGSKILFLDECLSSLDAETNTDIFLFLKQHCDHRLIIAISHEAVKGLFDSIIET